MPPPTRPSSNFATMSTKTKSSSLSYAAQFAATTKERQRTLTKKAWKEGSSSSSSQRRSQRGAIRDDEKVEEVEEEEEEEEDNEDTFTEKYTSIEPPAPSQHASILNFETLNNDNVPNRDRATYLSKKKRTSLALFRKVNKLLPKHQQIEEDKRKSPKIKMTAGMHHILKKNQKNQKRDGGRDGERGGGGGGRNRMVW